MKSYSAIPTQQTQHLDLQELLTDLHTQVRVLISKCSTSQFTPCKQCLTPCTNMTMSYNIVLTWQDSTGFPVRNHIGLHSFKPGYTLPRLTENSSHFTEGVCSQVMQVELFLPLIGQQVFVRVQEGKQFSDLVKMFEQTIKSKEESKKSKQKKVPDHHYTK